MASHQNCVKNNNYENESQLCEKKITEKQSSIYLHTKVDGQQASSANRKSANLQN